MNTFTQILWQIQRILGLTNSARYTANSIKRATDQSKARKLKKEAEKASQQNNNNVNAQ
jgi:hypothetical protein